MFGLTPLGTFHTAISLVAIVAGAWALVRDKEIVGALVLLYLVGIAFQLRWLRVSPRS